MSLTSAYTSYGKRFFDLGLVILTAPIWLPAIALVGVVVRFGLGTPIFFVDARAGIHGRPFRLFKFRTMVQTFDKAGHLLADAERLTRIGTFLRSTSLDEIPEVINVLCGHMSLVGPRPLPVRYLPRYTAEQAHRHDVRPGLTGLAQVSGRNLLDWNQKFAFDLRYVKDVSLSTDLRILMRSIVVVVRRTGDTPLDGVTAEEFNKPW